MTQVLVLGRRGQLATALAQSSWPEGWIVKFAGRGELDLTGLDDIEPFLGRCGADVVINTAAFTAVDRAESDQRAAFRLNAEAAGALAQACNAGGALLVHLSTDYVFGGEGQGPYLEDDPVAPVNVYGHSKAAGEQLVLDFAPDATVARTSWLMSPSAGFVAAILDRALKRGPLSVVDDQWGSPTLASDLARAVIQVAQDRRRGRGQAGRLHMAGPQFANWHAIASEVVAAVAHPVVVRPVPLADYVATAQRPRDSRLDVARLSSTHDIQMRPWTEWITETARDGLTTAANRVETRQQSGD